MLAERVGDFTDIRWRSAHSGVVDSTTIALGHGVNCQAVMGAGVAKQIRDLYGETMYYDYRFACTSDLLVPGKAILWWAVADGLAPLVHLGSQDKPGPHAKTTWIYTSVLAAGAMLRRRGVHHLALPRIGCGIGGLAWDQVKPVLQRAAQQSLINIEVWSLPANPAAHVGIPAQTAGEPNVGPAAGDSPDSRPEERAARPRGRPAPPGG